MSDMIKVTWGNGVDGRVIYKTMQGLYDALTCTDANILTNKLLSADVIDIIKEDEIVLHKGNSKSTIKDSYLAVTVAEALFNTPSKWEEEIAYLETEDRFNKMAEYSVTLLNKIVNSSKTVTQLKLYKMLKSNVLRNLFLEDRVIVVNIDKEKVTFTVDEKEAEVYYHDETIDDMVALYSKIDTNEN